MLPQERRVDLHVYVSKKVRDALRSIVYIEGHLKDERITLSSTVEEALQQVIPSLCECLLANHKNGVLNEDRLILEKLLRGFEQ